MPRYYFDVHDEGHMASDTDGVECSTMHEVAAAAVIGLPEMMRDVVPDGDRREIVVAVRDTDGRVVLRATLTLMIERLSSCGTSAP